MKNGIVSSSIVVAISLVGAASVFAQTAAVPAPPDKPVPAGTVKTVAPTVTPEATEKMAPIIVTGSAIPTTDTEGASPVTIVDAATIEKRGYQTAQDVLRNLPSAGGEADPGLSGLGFTPGASYISLRGLGPQATLVLINGRRVANYPAAGNGQFGFVDVNAIPAQIIDRIEVLTEGTAIYGADAVAGVVNIITKKSLPGENGEASLYIGNTDNHDSFEQRYTVLGNLQSFDKNGYGVVEADYVHQNSIFAGDREISKTADQTRNGGVDLTSGRTYPGYFIGENSGNDFSVLPGTPNAPLTGTTNATDPHVDDHANALGGFDYNPYTSLTPEIDRFGMYANYSYKLWDGAVTPNLDFSYRHDRAISQSAPSGYSIFGNDTGPIEDSAALGTKAFQVPTNNPFNQTGEVIDILTYRFSPVGPRITSSNTDYIRAVPSVDVKLGDGWTLNLGFNYGYNFLDQKTTNSISAAAFQRELNSSDPLTAYNPFEDEGHQSAKAAAGLAAADELRGTYSLISEDFRLNGKLFDLPAGPVQIAFGGEYRFERYNQDYPLPETLGDTIAAAPQQETATSRKVLSGYTEVSIPLTSPSFNIPGFYSTDVLVAGRVDKYSTFGSVENPEVRLRWEVIPGLVLRGGYAKSVRAPSLNELGAGGNGSIANVNDPIGPVDPITGETFHEVLQVTPGNPNLKPENAETFDAGLAYSPDFIKGLVLKLDYFKIRYANQISFQDAQALVDNNSPQVIRGPNGAISQINVEYQNLNNSYVDGVDFGANYVIGDPFASPYGQFTFTLDGTFYFNYVQDDGTGASNLVGSDSGGLGSFSRYRQDASFTWDYQNFSFTLSNDYTSGYEDTFAAQDLGIVRNVAAWVTFDLQASYQFDKEHFEKSVPGPRGDSFDWRKIVEGTRITVGCNNVYDFSPPFTASDADNLGFDQTYADPTGRFLYAQITKKF